MYLCLDVVTAALLLPLPAIIFAVKDLTRNCGLGEEYGNPTEPSWTLLPSTQPLRGEQICSGQPAVIASASRGILCHRGNDRKARDDPLRLSFSFLSSRGVALARQQSSFFIQILMARDGFSCLSSRVLIFFGLLPSASTPVEALAFC